MGNIGVEDGFGFYLVCPSGIGDWKLEVTAASAEATRVVLGLSSIQTPQLFQSPRYICLCFFECLFHILPLFPWLIASDQNLASDVCLQMIFLRNYHAIQWVYWASDYSGCRSAFYANLFKTESLILLAGKGSLKQHGFRSFCLLFAFAIIEGVLLPHGSLSEEGLEESIYSITHIRSYTIAAVPLVLYGWVLQGLLIFILHQQAKLTSDEDECCYTILHGAKHSDRCSKAARLIQRWWRMRERNPGRQAAPTFISPLQELQLARDRPQPSYFTLQKQIFVLERGIKAKMQATKEGIREAEMAVLKQLQTLIRMNYRIFVVCSSLRTFSINPKTQSRLRSKMHRRRLSIITEEGSEYAYSLRSAD